MADEPNEEAEADEVNEGEEPEAESEEGAVVEKRFKLNRKLLLMVVPPVLLLLGGGGFFGATSLGLIGTEGEKGTAAATAKLYYDLPEMVVNLSSREKRVQYLKLKVSLETSDQAAFDALTPVMPRVLDTFQLYLRELRSTDLDGSAGIFRLKEELLRRINLEIHPNQVNRVLFKEIIVQ